MSAATTTTEGGRRGPASLPVMSDAALADFVRAARLAGAAHGWADDAIPSHVGLSRPRWARLVAGDAASTADRPKLGGRECAALAERLCEAATADPAPANAAELLAAARALGARAFEKAERRARWHRTREEERARQEREAAAQREVAAREEATRRAGVWMRPAAPDAVGARVEFLVYGRDGALIARAEMAPVAALTDRVRGALWDALRALGERDAESAAGDGDEGEGAGRPALTVVSGSGDAPATDRRAGPRLRVVRGAARAVGRLHHRVGRDARIASDATTPRDGGAA